MREHDLTPVLVNPDDLTTYPGNPNHGDKDAIRDSIETNGFYEPIVVQKSTGYIVSGNHRLMVAREMRLDAVPVIYLDITDTEARRILLSSNFTARQGVNDDLAVGRIISLIRDQDEEYAKGLGLPAEEADDYLLMIEAADAEADRYAAAQAEEEDDPRPVNSGGWARPAPKATPGIKVPGADDPDYGATENGIPPAPDAPPPVNHARRVMILDLPLHVYAWLSDRLQELADERDLRNDVETILDVVGEATGTEPPKYTGPSDVDTDGVPGPG